MDEKKLFDEYKNIAIQDHEYFSNKNKPQREKYCVELLLSYLCTEYNSIELEMPPQESKVDIEFRDASFQVKEIVDEHFRRGEMYRRNRKAYEEADSFKNIVWNLSVNNIPSMAKMYDLVLNLAKTTSEERKYSELKGQLDLLIYVTRSRASLFKESDIDLEKFSDLGWRSVSCVNEKQAVIFYLSESAPKFMRGKEGIIFERDINH